MFPLKKCSKEHELKNKQTIDREVSQYEKSLKNAESSLQRLYIIKLYAEYKINIFNLVKNKLKMVELNVWQKYKWL